MRSLIIFALIIVSVGSVEAISEYDYGRETHCVNITPEYEKCYTTLYSGVRFVPEDGKWIEAENAKRLDDKGVFSVKSVKDDGIHGLDVVSFNHSCITLRPYPKDMTKFKYGKKIKLKIDGTEKGKVKIPGPLSPLVDIIFCFADGTMSHNYTFGDGSTTIKLQDADTENLEDAYLRRYYPDNNYGSVTAILCLPSGYSSYEKRILNKFDMTSLPGGATIESSTYYAYVINNGLDSVDSFDINIHHDYNQTWIEGDVTWNKVFGVHVYNTTEEDENSFDTDSPTGWYDWTVTNMVNKSYNDGDSNITFYLISDNRAGSPYAYDDIDINSKEYATTSQRPYLNITYSAGAPPPVPCCYENNVTNTYTVLANGTCFCAFDGLEVIGE